MCRKVVHNPVISGPIIVSIISGQLPIPNFQLPRSVDSKALGVRSSLLAVAAERRMAAVLEGARFLSADQFLLTTLIVKLAVMAVLATMLARYHRFRHILIFERRGWLDRLVFTLAPGISFFAGGAGRLLLDFKGPGPSLRG